MTPSKTPAGTNTVVRVSYINSSTIDIFSDGSVSHLLSIISECGGVGLLQIPDIEHHELQVVNMRNVAHIALKEVQNEVQAQR